MKKATSLITLFSLFLSISFSQNSHPEINWARISETLEAQMKKTPDNEYIQVSIILYDQVDLLSMMEYFRIEKASLERRAKTVITSLQNKAKGTQPALLSFLEELDGVEKNSIRSLWITNMIQARLKKDAISALSLRGDIDVLHFKRPFRFSDAKLEEHAFNTSTWTPGGHEIAHDLIKAPEMWAKGYTGTNRKVFVIDEGADLRHPALRRNYRGFVDGNDVSFFDIAAQEGDTIPSICAERDDHGTWVLGTAIGYDSRPNRRDTIGVAPDGLWMSSPLQVQNGNCTSAAGDDVFALQWAIDPDGDPNTIEDMPDVVNQSFGRDDPNECNLDLDSQFAITALEAAGVAVVVAGGNTGPGPMTVGEPVNTAISLVNTFSVGSIDQNLDVSTFSSRGPSLCLPDTDPLSIKPEVVAPGSQIRTTSNGATFSVIQGTSFSAPIVCGAFLLLKEAFPALSGEDIKLALYFSATDLGVAGEDNDYGMGLIDVPAAFDYLVAEGNTPEPRNPDANGLVYGINDLESLKCVSEVSPTFMLENSGTAAMTSATINYSYSDGTSQTINWTGNLAPKASEMLSLPAKTLPVGIFTLDITLTEVNGKTDYSLRDNVVSSTFNIFGESLPTVTSTNAEACAGGSAIIESTVNVPEREVVWFDAATGGEIVGVGSPFVTPEISASTTYYGEAMVVEFGGLPNPDVGQSFPSLSDDSYLRFDVLNDITIRSIKVYAANAGIRRIYVRDSEGNEIGRSRFLSLDPGVNKVVLNIDVPLGIGYRMTNEGQIDDLLTTANGFTFPMEIENVMRITGSDNGLYNHFYDWEIVSSTNCARVPAQVSVSGTAANAAFSPARDVVNLSNDPWIAFNNTSTGAVSYLWDFGDGTTSTDENPSHKYTEPGLYTVTLIVTAAGGCTDAAFADVIATGTVGLAEELAKLGTIEVFPNPSDGKFVLNLELLKREEVEIEIFDLPGKRVWYKSPDTYSRQKIDMDLSERNKGIYLIKVRIAGLTWTEKVIKL